MDGVRDFSSRLVSRSVHGHIQLGGNMDGQEAEKNKRKEKLRERQRNAVRGAKRIRQDQPKVALYSGKRKPPLYEFSEIFDTEAFFWFHKSLIKEGHWAKLPPSAKSVFPVIASYCNKNGKAWPSDITIGILCGRSTCLVNKGTISLKSHWSDRFEMKKTKKGKKQYFLNLNKNNDEAFLFYRYVIESGAWCQLKPTAQALYFVTRCFAYYDFETYDRLENQRGCQEDLELDLDQGGLEQVYSNRKYDVMAYSKYTKKQLAEFAGINENSMNEALQELEKNWLIERVDGGWLIHLKTKDLEYHPREYLNESVKKSYKYAIPTKKPEGRKSQRVGKYDQLS